MRALLIVALLAGRAWGDEAEEDLAEATNDPTLASWTPVAGAAVVFEASNDKKRAGGRIGLILGGSHVIDFKVSADLDDEGGAEPASLSGLGAGAVGEIAYAHVFWDPDLDPVATRKVCDAYVTSTFEHVCPEGMTPADCARDREAKLAAARDAFICAEDRLPEGSPYHRKYLEQVDVGTPVFVGVSVKATKHSFRYVDAMTLAAAPVDEELSWSAGAHGGFFHEAFGYAGLSVAYEEAWKGGKKAQICTPVGGMGATRCDSVVLGAPAVEKQAIFGGEWRRYLGAHLGVQFRVEVDHGGNIAARLPIYALVARDGLTGGVVFGYDAEEEEGTMTVFIGEAFEISP